MENKVLIKLICPEYDKEFDIFIPVNEVIWKIKKIFIKAVGDLCSIKITNDEIELINKINGRIYANNEIVIDTDIRNASEILFISKIKYTETAK